MITDLLRELNELDEHPTLEAKACAGDLGESFYETDCANNSFTSRLLLHHFLREEDLEWLRQVPGDLSESQSYAVIFLREQGAINNQTLRQLTGADVLSASLDLRKLRELKLVEQKGKGSATYYLPGPNFPPDLPAMAPKHGTLGPEHGTLEDEHGTLSFELPPVLQRKIWELGSRPGEKIRPLILELCAIRPFSASFLATVLGDRNPRALKREHLEPMRTAGQLAYLYPEMERHPKQAYRTVGAAAPDSPEAH